MKNKINYILDKDVDEELNKSLITILTICFPKQEIFTKQRYYKEIPQHRWYIQENKNIVAHLALHEKTITTEVGNFKIGGIAEVCVHPDYRGKGLTKILLEDAEKFSKKMKYDFLMLYGEEAIYASSGFRTIYNKAKYYDIQTKSYKIEEAKDAMIKEINNIDFPKGLIDINGPTF